MANLSKPDKYFSQSYYLDKSELKREHRFLCKKHHPDLGGSNAVMVAINLEYAELKQINVKPIPKQNIYSPSQKIINLLEKLDLEYWIKGDTIFVDKGSNVYECREELKKVGFWWHGDNKYWYWKESHNKRKRAG